ncbi:hypothetical protein [Shewanella sp. YLB-07]|uniref:hypothetical protein n=1 Tax=Shewanella sp. YLB-07 TaxID=2601268 RepID=UPI00128CA057|nr:hypothetical protein [Shewanella sp. YLB-07]MPY24368.1 hypothetical protein [Shewanella sp. YLB-07]
MFIIGLVGGTEVERDAVAAAFNQLDKATLGVFPLRHPVNGKERAKLLDAVIIKYYNRKFSGKGLVLSHIKTPEEAELVAAKGGVLMHIDGMPSSCIAIQRNDLMVTAKSNGDRHYLGPLEALSEVITRHIRVM